MCATEPTNHLLTKPTFQPPPPPTTQQNEDQLLGAQQRDAQPPEPQEQGEEEDEDKSKGVEMEDDFDGALEVGGVGGWGLGGWGLQRVVCAVKLAGLWVPAALE